MLILHRFWNEEKAATAIEYGLIAAGISVAIIVVVQGLGVRPIRDTEASARNPRIPAPTT
jgi:hypothetical protein